MGSEDYIFSYTAHRTGSTTLGSVFYETAGEGPVTLLLLHGFPFDRRLWYKLIPQLKGAKIILPDLPGFGNSALTANEASMETYAEAIYTVLQCEGTSRVILAGHSMGGYIALAFAEKYPHMVSGLSLIHSSAFADDEDRKLKREQVKAFITQHGAQQFTRSFVPGPFSPDFTNTPEIETLIHWAEDCTAEGLIAAVEAMKNRPDRTHVLKNLTIPVQFITGEKDPIFNPGITYQQAVIPTTGIIDLMKDSGHMGMIENADEMANMLTGFIQFCNLFKEKEG